MTADNNSTEDKPDPTPFKVYPMTNEARSKRMRGGPTREFASKEQAIKFAGRQVGGYYAVYQRGRKIWPWRPATYELCSEADYTFNAKGLDSQAAEPRSPRPDLRQRQSRPWDHGESWPR